MTIFVVENIEVSRRRKVFTLLGVDYCATPRSWVNLPLMIFIGIVAALILAPADQLLSKILVGIGYGLLIYISMFGHGLGHIISSHIVGTPMKTLLLTATVPVTLYDDQVEPPSRIHVGRSLGGPAFNFLLGVIAISSHMLAGGNHFLLFFGGLNLLFGVMTLLPIPSLDGAIILRELRDWR